MDILKFHFGKKSKSLSKAWVVAVHMGLGHIRAAYPLKSIAKEGILLYGSKEATPWREYLNWKKLRRAYYFFSRSGTIPLIGQLIFKIMIWVQRIAPYYPVKDMSRPIHAVFYLKKLITKKHLCRGLYERTSEDNTPIVHTFYATAIAMDMLSSPQKKNYLLITDTDLHRVWVAADPKKSNIIYLAPCTHVKDRLLTYGVPEERIHMIGFPLPMENIGSPTKMEIIKKDLFQRLLRLDPTDKFFSFHNKSVSYKLGYKVPKVNKPSFFTLMFAIGGAGVQIKMAMTILKSLKGKLLSGEIKLIFSAGISKKVNEEILSFIRDEGLDKYLGRSISVVFHEDIFKYMDIFNKALRTTDVLWTKPSELSFYCGLGLPIIVAPPVGTHEEYNRRWLLELHAGIIPPGKVEYADEWLFDLRDKGRLAEAAWDGFLKARKLGAYQIEKLVSSNQWVEYKHPLEQ